MIPFDLFLLITIFVTVPSILIVILLLIDNIQYYGKEIPKQLLIFPIISVILCVFIYEFWSNKIQDYDNYDVNIRQNVSYVFYNDRFINLNEKYHRNFYEGTVNIRFVSEDYRGAFGIICVPKSGIILEIKQ